MSIRRPGDPYEVGYAKPPENTRFRKGVSGNPRGRPRKKPDPYAELMAVLQEKVTITIEGVPQKVTIQQALLFRLRQEALSGKPWAEKLVLRILEAVPQRDDPIEAELAAYESHLRLAPLLSRVKTRQEIERGE